MWARIENNTVVEIIDFDPTGNFHPSLEWHLADPSVSVGDALAQDGTFIAPPQPSVLDDAATRSHIINSASELAMEAITAGYPESEIKSWDKQEAEARAYSADPASPTPLLSALAIARGIPVSDLAVRVITKSDAFAAAAGAIIGRRQALEDQINAIATDAALTDAEKRVAIEQVVW